MLEKVLYLSLGFLTFSGAALFAEDDGNVETGPVKGRSAWFVYTSMPDGLENPVNVMSGKDITKLLLSKLSPSVPVRVPPDGILRIVREVENPKDRGEPAYLTLAQATVPEAVTKALVILMPAAKNDQGLVFRAKVHDLASLKGGDCTFLNMTNLKIGVELGKTKILVEPGQDKTHNPLGSSNSVSLPIRVSFFDPVRQEWAMITASTVALYASRRELCIFNWDQKFNRVDFESITLPGF